MQIIPGAERQYKRIVVNNNTHSRLKPLNVDVARDKNYRVQDKEQYVQYRVRTHFANFYDQFKKTGEGKVIKRNK